MKIYCFTTLFGLALVLNGCGATSKMVKSQGIAPNGLASQMQAFAGLGDVVGTQNGFKITLSGDSIFKIGHSRLNQDGVRKIDALSDALLKYPGDHVAIMEYTDNSGVPAKNLKLSQHRANSIKAEMVKKSIPADNVTAEGKGEDDPVAPNDTPENQMKNRRVEIVITSL